MAAAVRSTSARSGAECPDWGCGTNSPTVGDGIVFDELNTAGVEDKHGIKIVEAYHQVSDSAPMVPVELHVEGHVLSAVATDGSARFEHDQLVGTVIKLHNVRDSNLDFELRVAAVKEQSLHFWAGDVHQTVPFYLITARPLGMPDFKDSICRGRVPDADAHWGGQEFERYVLAFEGDRYDAAAKQVRDVEHDPKWFNLACAGTAPAKLHLMRHTAAGSLDASGATVLTTSNKERTAMLKMFAADYCGTGQPFTVDGQPLLYGDEWAKYPETPTSAVLRARPSVVRTIEALWNEAGAVCLDTPRLYDRTCVETVCGRPVPRCGGIPGVTDAPGPSGPIGWEHRDVPGGSPVHVISANPP